MFSFPFNLRQMGHLARAFDIRPFLPRRTTFQAHFPRYYLRGDRHVPPLRTFSTPDFKDASHSQQLYELSLGLSRIPMNGNAEIEHTLYDSAGVSTKRLTKLEIANKYCLSTRDLRSIDLPSIGFPQILIREQTILIYMFSLRLLVQADQVLMFHAEGSTLAHEQTNQWRVFNHDIEGKLRGNHGSAGVSAVLPFELRVLEAALSSTTSTMEAEYLLAKEQISEALRQLDVQLLGDEESLIHHELRTLLDLVQILSGIEQRARHVRNAVQEVLNDDGDMAAMYLSDKRAGKPHAPEDHQDVEYLLEAYYKTSDAVVQKAASLLGKIQQKEESIQSILNVRRNQIMVLETKIEIAMLGLASATLVAGFYGMNVINYFEDSAWAFGIVTTVCLVGTAFVWRYGLRQLRQIQKVRI